MQSSAHSPGIFRLAAAACAALLCLDGAARAAADEPADAEGAPPPAELTVVSWGGAYTRGQVEALHRPFSERSGIVLRSRDYDGDLAPLRALHRESAGSAAGLEELGRRQPGHADAGRWDLLDVELGGARRGCAQGLLQPLALDELPPGDDGTPAAEDFIPGALHDCGVGSLAWSTLFAHSAERFADDPPEAIADFFDLERYPGKRGLRSSPQVNLEWALLADGVPADQVYATLASEAGAARAFARLDGIREQIVWWQGEHQPAGLLASGEVAMSSGYSGHLFNANFRADADLRLVWDGQVWELALWAIPAQAPNPGAAWDFLRFATSSHRLAAQTNYIPYGPVRRSALAQIRPELRAQLPTTAQNLARGLRFDPVWWAEHGAALRERFAAWLAQ